MELVFEIQHFGQRTNQSTILAAIAPRVFKHPQQIFPPEWPGSLALRS